eukprot:4014040-Pyramimonas_sp.AAC.2
MLMWWVTSQPRTSDYSDNRPHELCCDPPPAATHCMKGNRAPSDLRWPTPPNLQNYEYSQWPQTPTNGTARAAILTPVGPSPGQSGLAILQNPAPRPRSGRPWPCTILQDPTLWLTPVCADPRLKAPDNPEYRPLKEHSAGIDRQA